MYEEAQTYTITLTFNLSKKWGLSIVSLYAFYTKIKIILDACILMMVFICLS